MISIPTGVRAARGPLVRESQALMAALAIALGLATAAAAAAQTAQTEDACLNSLTVSPDAAERACSDRIARLSYLAEPGAGERQALASAHNNRAIARTRAGDHEGAAADLGEALILAPNSWAIYLNRGNLQLARSEPQAALADFERARQLAPASVAATARNSALAYRQLNDIRSAARSLAIALQAPAMAPAEPEPAVTPTAADSSEPPGPLPR